MALIVFKRGGEKAYDIYRSVIFFFLFIGHFFHSILFHWKSIAWSETIIATIRAGARVVIPLIILSILMGTAIAISINYMLAPFNLQNQAMNIAQSLIVLDFAPITVGFVLCTQCGLNLIEFYHPSLHETPQKVLYENIIPLIAGMNLTALFLYSYVSFAFFTSVYITFLYILGVNTDEYFLHLSGVINFSELITSVCKTILYATIASFTAGYYYYDVANRILPTRQAVSRIITRGLFWLITVSVFIKIYLF